MTISVYDKHGKRVADRESKKHIKGLGKGRKEKEFRNGKGNSEITSGKAFPVFEEAVKLRRLRGLAAAAAAAVLATGFMCLADTTYPPPIAFPISLSLSLYKEVTN